MKLHPGAFRLMKAQLDNDPWEIEDYKLDSYAEFVPEGWDLVEMIPAWDIDSYWAGYGDLYVFEDPAGFPYGVVFWRQGGKHADYDEIYEKAYVPYPDDEDAIKDWYFDPDDFVELKPLEIINKPRYKFSD